MRADETHLRIFDEHRALLFGIAYRMLGSVMDAEDILQDSYLAWSKTQPESIETPAAFLRTLVGRRCLDHLKSARVRRESYVGPWLPEPLRIESDPAENYEREELLRESLSTAFLILLESLNSVERAVYILREVFQSDFTEVAGIVEKTPENCRQILRRAREAVNERRKRFVPPAPDAAARMLEQFLVAVRSGDIIKFTGVLADDVRLHSDGGGVVTAALNIITGLENVAKFQLGVMKFVPEDVQLELTVLNGAPGLVLRTAANEVYSSMHLDFAEDGRIQNIYVMRNPHKLQHLA
ncbi:MAG: RNA polymerase sigma factor SigJ [bacterium]|nr:RNA polymerase sigma factor SigJ [bacterium]